MERKASSSTRALEREIRQRVRGNETDAELDLLIAELLAREAVQAKDDELSEGVLPKRQRLDSSFLNNVLRTTASSSRSSSTTKIQEHRQSAHSNERILGHGRTSIARVHADDVRSNNVKTRWQSEVSSSSKMDKYFEPHYDPRLDVQNDSQASKDGLVERTGKDKAWRGVKDIKGETDPRKDTDRHRDRQERREDRRKKPYSTSHRSEKDGNLSIGESASRSERKFTSTSSSGEKCERKRRNPTSDEDDRNRESRSVQRKREKGRHDDRDPFSSQKDPRLQYEYSSRAGVREWDKGKVVQD